jgi:peptidoglycan hydrolase-like protein with peptidoglycan-binding domain
MPVLKKGSKGEAVKRLQQSLYQLGYDPGTVDGIFGPKTESAVKAFQRSAGIDVDGIVGEITWTTIEESFPFEGEVSAAG